MSKFIVKRIYEEADASDGYRVLVDRLWPRGISKERAALDEWAKDLAPSTQLRQWFGHDPAKFAEFRQRYVEEIKQSPEFEKISDRWQKFPVVTLLYAARDEQHNEARVLAEFLNDR